MITNKGENAMTNYISALRKMSRAQRRSIAHWVIYAIEYGKGHTYRERNKGRISGFLRALQQLEIITTGERQAVIDRAYGFIRRW